MVEYRYRIPCVYLNYREAEVQVLKRTLSHNSYRLLLNEIMVQGTTNIGQLVSQLSLSEKYGSGRTMGTSRVLLYISISVV